MRLIDRLTQRDSARAVLPSGAQVLMQTFGTPNSERILPSYLNSVESYSSSGVVFGVIQARMSLFTEAEFKFQRLADKGLYGTPALDVLEHPWPGGTTGELLARMEQDVSLAGNSYIRRTSDGLERLRPDCVSIISEIVRDANDTETRQVIGYWFDPTGWDGDRQPDFFPVEEVAHWAPIPDPWATWRGMSWLTPVLREVDADTQLTDYKRAYLNNAATPNLLIKYNGKIGGEKLGRLKDQLQARHGGVGNAFKTLVLDEGADASVVGNNLEQLAFSATQAAGENRIAVAGNVPAIVVGLKEGLQAATYSNYEQAMRRFADLFGRPQWRSACAALAKLVEVPADSRLWVDISAIAALRQGEKEQADTMAVLATAAAAFIAAGYEAESIKAALSSGDVTLLKHTGLVSVQLQEPGATPPPPPNQRSMGEDVEAIVRAASPSPVFQIQPSPVETRTEVHVPESSTEVHNHIEPSPVAVQNVIEPSRAEVIVQAPAPEVRVEVNPTPVEITNQVDVQPAEVAVLPSEPRTRRIERDRKGEIVAVHEE